MSNIYCEADGVNELSIDQGLSLFLPVAETSTPSTNRENSPHAELHEVICTLFVSKVRPAGSEVESTGRSDDPRGIDATLR